MNSLDTEERPLTVRVLEHEVVLMGPRVAIALSATAAAETARRLAEAAEIASKPDGPEGYASQALLPDA